MGAMIAAVLSPAALGDRHRVAAVTSAGPGAAPLVIVGVVAAYLTTLALEGRLGAPSTPVPDAASEPPPVTPRPEPAGP